MIKIKKKLIYYLTALIFLSGCDDENSGKGIESINLNEITNEKILDWENIYDLKITSLVSETIIIKTKLYWDTSLYYSNPTPIKISTGEIKLLFENADKYISNIDFHNQNRGNLILKDKEVFKYTSDKTKKDQYILNGEDLLNNEYYFIKGKIEYRDLLYMTKNHLNDSFFIKQSNDVTYWSQTFEFISEKIYKAN